MKRAIRKSSGIILAVLLFISVQGFAQDFRAPLPQQALQPELRQPAIGGAIPRIAQLPRPLDAINPFLPLSYGTGADLVYYEDNDPFERPRRADARPLGIRLLSFPW